MQVGAHKVESLSGRVAGGEGRYQTKIAGTGVVVLKIPVPLSEVRASIQGSLDRLGFVPDCYLIHNPFVPAPGSMNPLPEHFPPEGFMTKAQYAYFASALGSG